MTLEEVLSHAYGLAMTPLPGPPQLSEEQFARLRAAGEGLAGMLPSLPERLPMMPEWMRRYSEERGLLPGQVEAASGPPVVRRP